MTHQEQHTWYSGHLGQDMTLRVYGHAGKPFLVFPCQEGHYNDYEGFGMTETLRPWIDSGCIRLFTVDSVDAQSWCNKGAHPRDRALRHAAYDRYLTDEVVPFIKNYGDLPITPTGCSMGAYHAVNFFFRYPYLCDSVIALSGLYRLNLFIGDYMDDEVYLQTPLAYLPNMQRQDFLERYRQSKIFVGVGQGAWEEDMLADTIALKRILDEKQIPAFIDIWGHDVNHDWPWWHKMMPYFLEKLVGAPSYCAK